MTAAPQTGPEPLAMTVPTSTTNGEGSDEGDRKAQLSRLLRLVTTGLEAAALEALLMRLMRDGRLATVSPAGDARVAMIAAAAALAPGDLLLGTARDLPAALARGLTFEAALQQAFGTAADTALGRGLPGAIHDGVLGVGLTDGNIASHLTHAAGFGHAARLRGEPRVALALFGGAAQAHGELHAALNFAALYRAQAIFVARGPLAGELPLTEAAPAWGIRAVRVPGDDGLAIWDAVAEARARAVAGEGPTVVDARLDGPLTPRDAQALQALSGWPPERQRETHDRIDRALVAARRAAEAAPPPALETLTEAVFSDRPWHLRSPE